VNKLNESKTYQFNFNGNIGYVEVNNGRARMVEMEDEICPKSICSDTGGIQAAYQSIVRLPNQIIVRTEGAKDDDEILWSLKLNSRIYTMKVMNLNNVKLMITFNIAVHFLIIPAYHGLNW